CTTSIPRLPTGGNAPAWSSQSDVTATVSASSARARRRRRAAGAPVASWTMDLERFCAASRVVIVAGKGGVGKTTVTAALATAVPGMKDILVLGKVKQLERAGAADLIVLDAPAAGHAVSFLLSARGLLDAVRVGPVSKQAADVVEMLRDPERCRVLLVTVP